MQEEVHEEVPEEVHEEVHEELKGRGAESSAGGCAEGVAG